jgi:NAD(P)-dependent dehydrogenase (short-subunit alcohol dehydrogenase family)
MGTMPSRHADGQARRRLAEQVILVTGATDGLGRYLVGQLAAAGARVVVHGRNAAKLERLDEELASRAGDHRIEIVLADFADLRRVDRLADEVLDRLDRLDVLVNNAGIGFGAQSSARELSADGYELRFAVNYLACYHLTRRLLPLVTSSAPARIVNVASAGQVALDFDDLMMSNGYDGVTAYRRSKLAQIMFTFDLAAELDGSGVTVNALHPATFMDTPLVQEAGVRPMSTIEEGGTATLRLITAPELAGVTGRYFDGTREARALDQAYEPAARARLRELTEDLIQTALGRVPNDPVQKD